ncbi:unnamed protein product, partial [Porites evermanni]
LRAGFEPARGNPIGFQVQRLNHSAIAASTFLPIKFGYLKNGDKSRISWNSSLTIGSPYQVGTLKSKNDYRCEQDSNLRGGTPLDFKSNALTTRPSQHLYVMNLTLNDLNHFEKEFTKQEVTLREGFEPARGYPIGFRVQRLNHSAIA